MSASFPSIRRSRQVAWAQRGGSRSADRSLSLRLAAVVVCLLAIATVTSAVWTPYPPMAPATGPFYAAPSWTHLFGTDSVGGDVLSRWLAATHMDVGITVAVVGANLVVGTVWGALVGFYGGWLDVVTQRMLQVFNSFPALLLAMLLISAIGRGLFDAILVVAFIPLPDYVRLARAEIMTRKTWQFAEAARLTGNRPLGVLFRHIVPNSTRALLSFASINASWVVATVGALGFLGLGIQPGSAEWGSMVAGGEPSISSGVWWISFFPGLGIFLLSLAFHLIGDGIADADIARQG